MKSSSKHTAVLNFLFIAFSCTSINKELEEVPLFTLLPPNQTGINFTNTVTDSKEMSILNYHNFYNGGGVAIGDINGDGKPDIFFTSNQGENKLYLNKGGLSFTDVTKEAKIPQDGAWSTGVSVVDINNDGLLDIYVCRVGEYETLHGRNQLLICKGIDKNWWAQLNK